MERERGGEMEKMGEEAKFLHSQAEIMKCLLSFADSMALKCAVELRIADIIHSHGRPMTLSQIASNIDSPLPPDTGSLARIMRLLVAMKIFSKQVQSNDYDDTGDTTVYGLTDFSRWILRDSELSLAPFILMQNHPWLLAPLHELSSSVKEGGLAFEKTHGRKVWDIASTDPEFNNIFNDAMRSLTKITLRALLSGYKDGWAQISSLVDVGGGTGAAIAEILKAYPHIKGINFDLPHVIAAAPNYDGVSHVAGDMFNEIPQADEAIMLKAILHDWGDEDCLKILRNCRSALPKKSGKLLIVDIVLNPENDGLFHKVETIIDIIMLANTGGKERTELEWKKILEEGGFSRYNIIELPDYVKIIEAYPE